MTYEEPIKRLRVEAEPSQISETQETLGRSMADEVDMEVEKGRGLERPPMTASSPVLLCESNSSPDARLTTESPLVQTKAASSVIPLAPLAPTHSDGITVTQTGQPPSSALAILIPVTTASECAISSPSLAPVIESTSLQLSHELARTETTGPNPTACISKTTFAPPAAPSLPPSVSTLTVLSAHPVSSSASLAAPSMADSSDRSIPLPTRSTEAALVPSPANQDSTMDIGAEQGPVQTAHAAYRGNEKGAPTTCRASERQPSATRSDSRFDPTDDDLASRLCVWAPVCVCMCVCIVGAGGGGGGYYLYAKVYELCVFLCTPYVAGAPYNEYSS